MSRSMNGFGRAGLGVLGLIVLTSCGRSTNAPDRVVVEQAKPSEKSGPSEKQEPSEPVVKPAFYTVDHYDVARDSAKDLAMTIERAKAEKKNILVQVGGDWCGWCKLMCQYIETNDKVRESILSNYLVMKVTYDKDNTNADFLSQYPPTAGYPHLFVLDSDGKLLHSQRTDELEEGHGYNESVYLEFLNKWKPGP